MGRGFVVPDLPWTAEMLRRISPFEFENWAVIALGGASEQGAGGAGRQDGSPDVDAFKALMERENRRRGFFVTFDYSQDAVDECAAFFRRTGRVIKLLTAAEILDEQHVQKM